MRLRDRLTFANAMSLVAVFVALGGSAWAVTANSIGSRQLKPNAVRTGDVAPDAITSAKVDDGSLLRADFAASELPQGPQGAQGPQGPQGSQGPQGVQGPPGVSGYEIVQELTASNNVDAKDVTADCPSGKRALGGGAYVNSSGNVYQNIAIDLSAPIANAQIGTPTPEHWTAAAHEHTATGDSWQLIAYAICGRVE